MTKEEKLKSIELWISELQREAESLPWQSPEWFRLWGMLRAARSEIGEIQGR